MDPTVSTSNTILIADDEELNRAILGNIFAKDYHIAEAENGEEALRLLRQDPERFCAVLLDVFMPVMGGLELLKELRAMGV